MLAIYKEMRFTPKKKKRRLRGKKKKKKPDSISYHCYLTTCSITGILLHSSSKPFVCKGGKENSLTVELLLLTSLSTLNAANVLFTYKLSMYSISANSLGNLSNPSFSKWKAGYSQRHFPSLLRAQLQGKGNPP